MRKCLKKIDKAITAIISYTLAITIAGIIIFGGFWFYDEVYTQIPKITEEKLTQRPETTKITDKNGVVLFKIFDQDREYMPAYQISPHMLNAIVSIEDKNFWKHPGIDIWGILRAIKDNLFSSKPLQGASTIDQQLMKNLFLNNKKTLKRKIKEAILTIRFHKYLRKKYSTTQNIYTKEQIKLKILELYLNYIPFGNNTFGIQTAAKKYFNTNAKNLTILQSSILASLPKGTSIYNPYTNKNKLTGEIIIYDKNGNTITNQKLTKYLKTKYLIQIKQNILKNKQILNKSREKNLENILKKTKLEIREKNKKYTIFYQYGRKDIVLSKMLEFHKISQEQYQKAFANGLDIQFFSNKNNILAPHFVFFIMKRVKKERGEEVLKKGGLTIKTSLDLNIQKKIETALKNNKALEQYGANNSANITINTQNGDIISYVGSKDFRNNEIGGQNDLIQSQRQLGSVLKPLFYAKAFDDLNIGKDTIIPDMPIKIGNYIPRNYDNKFKGKIPVKIALSHSRNIPAIKIFYDLGGEPFAKILFKKLGINSAKENKRYGHNMVLGGVDMPIYELVKAFRHLSNKTPAKINPILEIRDKNNTIIYKKKNQKEQSIFSKYSIDNIFTILGNSNNFEKRVKYRLRKHNITFAVKSGTSSMKLSNGEERARDGVLIGYNQNYITIFWAGNTDGSAMNKDAYGFFLNINGLKAVQKVLK